MRAINTNKAVLATLIHSFNITSVKIPSGFFVEMDRLILNSYGNAGDPEEPKQS